MTSQDKTLTFSARSVAFEMLALTVRAVISGLAAAIVAGLMVAALVTLTS